MREYWIVDPRRKTVTINYFENNMINIKENLDLNTLNHSCAHLMAQAVKHIFPNAKFWVGPVIDSGFYYDVDLGDVKLTEEDLPKIEKKMAALVASGEKVKRFEDLIYLVEQRALLNKNENI